ncbi:hypothetical protein K443DRAFT_5353 [Laccaria amethystina LaAM-08-1]|uniref:Uncharacterized protein n=1 Tax=Laccaria amethystina LaAM-08-1 TaxID=1095629 RepID=A0A0C9Y0Q8_9AGAR|nr:hypothetical protein K443DRAFT_5353 [Laccaria amethystina LaAM-08-1]
MRNHQTRRRIAKAPERENVPNTLLEEKVGQDGNEDQDDQMDLDSPKSNASSADYNDDELEDEEPWDLEYEGSDEEALDDEEPLDNEDPLDDEEPSDDEESLDDEELLDDEEPSQDKYIYNSEGESEIDLDNEDDGPTEHISPLDDFLGAINFNAIAICADHFLGSLASLRLEEQVNRTELMANSISIERTV